MQSSFTRRELAGLARMCAASYDTPPHLVRLAGGVELLHMAAQGSNGAAGPAIVAIRGSQIRGTEAYEDWRRNLQMDQVWLAPPRATRSPAAAGRARVHRGFADAAIRIEHWWRTAGGPPGGHGLVIAGHSLGGGIAQVLAAWLPAARVAVFGAPAAGNAALIELIGERLTRVEHRRDVVCGLLDRVPGCEYVRGGRRVGLGAPVWRAAIEDALAGRLLRRAIEDHAIERYVEALEAGETHGV
ncbi:MAG TPA: lipase family protein [Phycisphaerae bacterium]|nr:lipase family protein [Phycisphaerae bacterium]